MRTVKGKSLKFLGNKGLDYELATWIFKIKLTVFGQHFQCRVLLL